MELKFSIGERVKVIGKDIIGEVVQKEYKYMGYLNGNELIIKRYLIKYVNNPNYQKWYEEDELASDLELSSMYAIRVYDELIDVGLKIRNFDMVKVLIEERNKYIK